MNVGRGNPASVIEEGARMSHSAPTTEKVDLYSRIHEFYAEQMQLLDSGATDKWAATFTEDGVFAANGRPDTARGRAAIATGARAAAGHLAQAELQHRHWLGMLTVHPEPDGTVRTQCYALVIEIPRGGSASIRFSTVCRDLLVPDGESWLVRDRYVSRDDLAGRGTEETAND
jgi:SnoaL-like domain